MQPSNIWQKSPGNIQESQLQLGETNNSEFWLVSLHIPGAEIVAPLKLCRPGIREQAERKGIQRRGEILLHGFNVSSVMKMLIGQRRHEGIFLQAAWVGAATKASGYSFMDRRENTCGAAFILSACVFRKPKSLSFIDFPDWLLAW